VGAGVMEREGEERTGAGEGVSKALMGSWAMAR